MYTCINVHMHTCKHDHTLVTVHRHFKSTYTHILTYTGMSLLYLTYKLSVKESQLLSPLHNMKVLTLDTMVARIQYPSQTQWKVRCIICSYWSTSWEFVENLVALIYMTHIQTNKHTDTDTYTHRHRCTQHRYTDTDTQRHTQTHTDTRTHTHTLG